MRDPGVTPTASRGPTVHRSEFVRQLRSKFPEIEPLLKGSRLNLTMEVSAFLQLTRQAIEQQDWLLVERCFRFVDELLPSANRAVANSLRVSYLEGLTFSGPQGGQAFRLLSNRLEAEWAAVHEYLRQCIGKPAPVVGAER
jgi:hypothetical protein